MLLEVIRQKVYFEKTIHGKEEYCCEEFKNVFGKQIFFKLLKLLSCEEGRWLIPVPGKFQTEHAESDLVIKYCPFCGSELKFNVVEVRVETGDEDLKAKEVKQGERVKKL